MLMIAHLGDDAPAPTAPTTSDPLAAAAFIFNNRNAQISDVTTTASLRGKSVSEADIAAGFAKADGATVATVWDPAPDANALGFATATITNNLRLGVSVPVIVSILRTQRLADAQMTEPLIAEAFRRVQVGRLPPPKPGTPPAASSGMSNVMIGSLVITGLAAAGGAVLLVRRRRSRGFGSDYNDDGGDVPDVRRLANFLAVERKRRDQKLVPGDRVTVTGAPRVSAPIDCGKVIGPGGKDGTYVVKDPKTGVLHTIAATKLKRC